MSSKQRTHIDMYWWNKGNNFGDVMNPLFFEAATGLPVKWSNDAQTSVFTAAGSLIDTFHTKPGWTIWGAGVISVESGIPDNLNILAVRGPKTRQHLLSCGYTEQQVPEIYGDPGLLLPSVFPADDSQTDQYDLGIVPHYAFRLNPSMYWQKVKAMLRLNPQIKSVQIISPKLPVHEFLSRINSCKAIAASSLHGLIMAIAYQKKWAWIHFENDPFTGRITSPFVGDTFKYIDFLQSISRPEEQPIVIKSNKDWGRVFEEVTIDKPFDFDPSALLKAFPYQTPTWESFSQRAIAYYQSAKD